MNKFPIQPIGISPVESLRELIKPVAVALCKIHPDDLEY